MTQEEIVLSLSTYDVVLYQKEFPLFTYVSMFSYTKKSS